MAWNIITVRPGVPNQRSHVQLEGVEYLLDLRWNQRCARWFADIRSASGADLALGVALELMQPSLGQLVSVQGLPPGELIMIDPRPTPAYPTLAELGDVVSLFYIDSEHVVAAGGTTPPLYSWGAT